MNPPRAMATPWHVTQLLELGWLEEVAATTGVNIVDRMVRLYQCAGGLTVDGIAGPVTRSALTADLGARSLPAFSNFRGSLAPIVQFEGHSGRAYWPGGASGITLDPGFDLQFHSAAELAELYGHAIGKRAVDRLRSVRHLRGDAARQWVQSGDLDGIEISRELAASVLPRIAAPYWESVVELLPQVRDETAPRGLHSALLSFTYNAGADRLKPMRQIAPGDWHGFAEAIWRGPGDRHRRSVEAGLVGLPGFTWSPV